MRSSAVPFIAGAYAVFYLLRNTDVVPDWLLVVVLGAIGLVIVGSAIYWLFWRAPRFVPWTLFTIAIVITGFVWLGNLFGFGTVLYWIGVVVGGLLFLTFVPVTLEGTLREESVLAACGGAVVLFAIGAGIVAWLDSKIDVGGLALSVPLWLVVAVIGGFIIGKLRQRYALPALLMGCATITVVWLLFAGLPDRHTLHLWWVPIGSVLLGVVGLTLGLARNYNRHAF